MQKILALSSSRVGGGGYLQQALNDIHQFLGNEKLNVVFVPFASVDGYDEYTAKVQDALASLPYQITGLQHASAKDLIQNADVVMVGGGNTFKLMHDLYQEDVVSLIQEKVKSGMPYIGWSAGANITGLSIRTTNDMPIIQPPTFDALCFLPFQINPHYLNETREGFHGETRDQRLEEFIKLNLGIPVLGLPEGTALHYEAGKLLYKGNVDGVLFESNENNQPVRRSIEPNSDLHFLLQRNKF